MHETDKITARTCKTDEVVIREGEPGRHVYLIISGSVNIYKTVDGEKQLLNSLGSGEIFGEMGLLSNRPRYATVVAAEETRLIMVNDKAFHQALRNDKLPIIRPLAKQLVTRLREAEESNRRQARLIARLQKEIADPGRTQPAK